MLSNLPIRAELGFEPKLGVPPKLMSFTIHYAVYFKKF